MFTPLSVSSQSIMTMQRRNVRRNVLIKPACFSDMAITRKKEKRINKPSIII
jgi:hypothetical protein